jgi:uncharacterized protein YecE (DUF72 family)
MRIHVGTSGYNYPEWRGTFYPADLPAKQMFPFYARAFETVEINYTFYRMPTPKTVSAWKDQAPAAFAYALKAPQRITHLKRLKDAGESIRLFCETALLLGPHLGPLLFQLPPSLKCDVARLDAALAEIPAGLRVAVEFRHDSWHNDEVYAALTGRQAAMCVADFGDKTTPLQATARHGYLRLRDEGYQDADLARWADRIAGQQHAWDEVFVYFKHEDEGKGPEFAKAFLRHLEERGLGGRPLR